MSSSLLLSHFLRGLNPRDLPPEVEEHRVRLRRSASDAGLVERALQKWTPALTAEYDRRSRLDVAQRQRAGAPSPADPQELERRRSQEKEELDRDLAARSEFDKAARQLFEALEDATQRILADAPSLDSHEELLRFFKERQVYQPEPFVVREFEPQDENTNEGYKQILIDAVNVAIEHARQGFVPEVKKFSYGIAALAVLAANSFGFSIFMFQDNPLRLSIGLLVCFDMLLAIAYIFYKMSRSKETQLRAHIQQHIEAELTKARAEIARLEAVRYNQFLDEERERRETWEKEQEKKRSSFDRAEAQRLDGLQPLFAGKANAVQAALSSLLPLRLPAPFGVSFKVQNANVTEVTLLLPDDRVLPPPMLRSNPRAPALCSAAELELNQASVALAAALAIRHAAEILFNIPTCQTVVVNGVRSYVDSETRVIVNSQVLNAEIDRRTLGPMGRTLSPLMALKRFKHRISGGERRERRTA